MVLKFKTIDFCTFISKILLPVAVIIVVVVTVAVVIVVVVVVVSSNYFQYHEIT